MISEKNAIAVAEINWSAISFDGDGHQIYHFERDYLLRFAQGIEKAIDENRYESADDLDAEIHRLLEMKIDRFPQYAKSLLEGYATKVEVFDHMIKVAQAAGFESLTEAISVAKKARAATPSFPRDAWKEPFAERHEFDTYPDHFMTGLRNEFAAGWHAAIKASAPREGT